MFLSLPRHWHVKKTFFRPVEVLAKIDKTGAGKSTIAQLICRLYDVDKGLISMMSKK